MCTMPVIDMAATGQNIARMRQAAGLTVKDLQTVFGFSTPQAIYKWQRGSTLPTSESGFFATSLTTSAEESAMHALNFSGYVRAVCREPYPPIERPPIMVFSLSIFIPNVFCMYSGSSSAMNSQ